jgi:UDP-N-acetyl-D-glucosamine dehydrogenase
VPWDRQSLESYDAVIIATDHAAVDYVKLADWARLIVDTRNAMAGIDAPPGKVWKA